MAKGAYFNDLPARRLREWRAAHGWIQTDVAKRLGKTQQAIGDLERGRSSPSFATIAEIARRAFNVSLEQFLAGPGVRHLATTGITELPYFPAPTVDEEGLAAPAGVYPVPATFGHPRRHAVLRVPDENMRPALHEDDLVVVDRRPGKILPGLIYVVRDSESRDLVRRLRQVKGVR